MRWCRGNRLYVVNTPDNRLEIFLAQPTARLRPVTNVVAVFVVAATFIPILIAYYLTRGGGAHAN